MSSAAPVKELNYQFSNCGPYIVVVNHISLFDTAIAGLLPANYRGVYAGSIEATFSPS